MLLVKDQSALRVELTILLLIGPLFPEAMNVWSMHPIGSHMLATRCPQNLSFHGSAWLPREKCLPRAPPKFRCPVMSSWIDASADVLLSFGINRGVCWSGIRRWKRSGVKNWMKEKWYKVLKEKWYMGGVEGCPADVRNQSRCRHKQKAGKCSTAGVWVSCIKWFWVAANSLRSKLY